MGRQRAADQVRQDMPSALTCLLLMFVCFPILSVDTNLGHSLSMRIFGLLQMLAPV